MLSFTEVSSRDSVAVGDTSDDVPTLRFKMLDGKVFTISIYRSTWEMMHPSGGVHHSYSRAVSEACLRSH